MSKEKKVLILGIGNKMKADDGFGVILSERLRNLESDNLRVIHCEEVPENFLDKIVAYNPDIIILLDTVYKRNSLPGEIITLRDFKSPISVSTHSGSLKIFLDVLKMRGLSFKTFLLGVVPKNVNMGGAVSPEVREAMEKILEKFSDYLLEFKKDA